MKVKNVIKGYLSREDLIEIKKEQINTYAIPWETPFEQGCEIVEAHNSDEAIKIFKSYYSKAEIIGVFIKVEIKKEVEE